MKSSFIKHPFFLRFKFLDSLCLQMNGFREKVKVIRYCQCYGLNACVPTKSQCDIITMREVIW